MAELFRPLMEHIVADAPPTTAPKVSALPTPIPAAEEVTLPAFSDLLRAFLREFAKARSRAVPEDRSALECHVRCEDEDRAVSGS